MEKYEGEDHPKNEKDFLELAEKTLSLLDNYRNDEDWTEVKKDEDIGLYEKVIDGEPLPLLRVETELIGTPEEVSSVIGSFTLDDYRIFDRDLAELELLEKINDNMKVAYLRYNTPRMITSREAIFFSTTKVLTDGTIVSCGKSILHESRPLSKSYIRIKGFNAYFMSALENKRTKLVRLILIDPMGSIPQFVINLGKKSMISTIRRMVSLITKKIQDKRNESLIESNNSESSNEYFDIEGEIEPRDIYIIKQKLKELDDTTKKIFKQIDHIESNYRFNNLLDLIIKIGWPILVVFIYHYLTKKTKK